MNQVENLYQQKLNIFIIRMFLFYPFHRLCHILHSETLSINTQTRCSEQVIIQILRVFTTLSLHYHPFLKWYTAVFFFKINLLSGTWSYKRLTNNSISNLARHSCVFWTPLKQKKQNDYTSWLQNILKGTDSFLLEFTWFYAHKSLGNTSCI